jgi:hypothetical protein
VTRFAAGALAVLVLTGCATGSALEPHIRGWEQFFRLDWTAAERSGETVLEGYLSSDSPGGFTGIGLLIESLDAAGTVLVQRVVWLPGELTPFSRTHFSAPAPLRAPHYRVRVFTFDRLEIHSWGD